MEVAVAANIAVAGEMALGVLEGVAGVGGCGGGTQAVTAAVSSRQTTRHKALSANICGWRASTTLPVQDLGWWIAHPLCPSS